MNEKQIKDKGLLDQIAIHRQQVTDLQSSETELLKVLENLKQKDDLYRLIAELSNDGIVVMGNKGLLFFNRTYLDMLGYSGPEDRADKTVFFNIHPDDRPMVADYAQRRLAGETVPSRYEFRMLKKDNSIIYVEASAAVITYLNDKASLIFIRDITQRKQTESKLKESEEKYRLVVENASEGILVAQDGKLKFMNQAALEIIGYSEDIMKSMPFTAFIHPEDRDMVYEYHVSRLRGEDRPPHYAFRIITGKGSVKWVELHAVTIDWEGHPATLNFQSDVTERKQAEAALIKERERFQNLVEQAPYGMMLVEKNGAIGYINPKFTEIFGYTKQEVPDLKTWRTNAYPDKKYREEIGVTLEADLEHLKTGGRLLRTFTVMCKDGMEKVINFIAVELKDDQFLIACEDITERRKLETQLLQAQKMEAVGTLAGGIAHDFNNLLMGIQGYASLMLLNIDAGHPHYEKLKAIEDQVQSGADLTRQLLGFARGGRYEVKITDLNKLIRKAASLFGRTKKEIRIYEKYAESLWHVEADRGQLEQVLLNLFVNAWQAMPGGGSLYLETENVILDDHYIKPYNINPGAYAKISVTDTGVGMDEKTRARVFDPFFTTKGMGRGTGLGLASAYGIIKGHGGMINVYSETGHGTAFHIYLPASLKELAKEDLPSHPVQKGHETILIVDDEKTILEVTKAILENLGYHILTAQTGHEAIDIYLADSEKIDLVILDMVMPVMGGGETFVKMKAFNPDIKAILSSGYSLSEQAKSIMDQGIKAFIQKPYRLDDLSQKIRDVIEMDTGRRKV